MDYLRSGGKLELPKSKSGKKRLKAALRHLVKTGADYESSWVVDTGASKAFAGKPAYEVCPCITRTRGGSGGYWVTSLQRNLNIHVAWSLPGVGVVITCFSWCKFNCQKFMLIFPLRNFNHLQSPAEEIAQLQGWDVKDLEPLGTLSCAQLGKALGNAWNIPLATLIIRQIAKAMGWL